MHRKFAAGFAAVLIGAFLAPMGAVTSALADQRCTPIAHAVDASKIPLNASQDPDSKNPDAKYHDAAGLNCIPTYELDFAGAVNDPNFPKGTCDPESKYDQAAAAIAADPAYYAACKRLKFTMGPLIARPGMNDSLIHVTTFEHPMYNGYTIRWKPGLQSADGTVPLVEQLHLHHGTWIGGVNGPAAATGPFFATGEEQTILQFPKGYGWSMSGQSAWLMLYMLHNALPTTQAVYITYDIDYISTPDATTLGGIKDLKSLWLDVGSGKGAITASGSSVSTPAYSSFNPIFNAQKGFGHGDNGAFWGLTNTDGSNLSTVPIQNNFGTGKNVCYWPRENCAGFNSSQGKTNQQGNAVTSIIGNRTLLDNPAAFAPCPAVIGADKRCGVIEVMGGHLHPGGLRDEVSLLRGNKIVPIHISDAAYWGGSDFSDPKPEQAGATPTSWDLSMGGTFGSSAGSGRAKDAWKILVQQGDALILNGIYDTNIGSAYDQMGIVMSWMTPGYEADAIDPFDPNTIIDAGWAQGPNLAARPPGLPAAIDHGCDPGTITSGTNAGKTVLCLRGNVTHGSMPSRQNHRDCTLASTCPPLTAARVPLASTTISMQGFSYGQMDQSIAQVAGVPRVARNTKLTFYNPDTAGAIWHTVTACAAPCTGATTANYPYPAAGNTPVDFDSTILCVGLGCATAGVFSWSYTPTQPGPYTFFCRIHPFMRGAFEVT